MSHSVLDPPAVGPAFDPPAFPPPSPPSPGGPSFGLVAGAFGAFFVLFLAALGALLLAANRGTDETAAAAKAGAATVLPAGQPLAVQLGDMFVKPKAVTVARGQDLVLDVTNGGAIQHNITLDGAPAQPLIDPGGHAKVDLGAITKSTTAYCTVAGHREAGMVMRIDVAGEAPASTGAPASGAGSAAAKSATIDPAATPAASWKAADPTLQPALGGTVHDIAFDITESVHEVAPGVTQKLWTFNDRMPGPTIHVKLGDVVNLTLTNGGTIGHSIDFHASEVAPNVEMRTIKPGESLVYRFKAEHAGIFMYHCGTAPALHHIGNGMFGALVVDPPDLAPVAKEFLLVQNELYLGPQGQPGDLTKMQSVAFDAVTFNGYYNQYKFSPVHVQPGEKVRVWVLDAGPSENSSFHIVGTVFDTVYKEGAYTLRGGVGAGGAQALDLQPAQGGFVEFTLDRAGTYPMVTHKFSNVGKGALGLWMAGDGGGQTSH